MVPITARQTLVIKTKFYKRTTVFYGVFVIFTYIKSDKHGHYLGIVNIPCNNNMTKGNLLEVAMVTSGRRFLFTSVCLPPGETIC